VLVARSGGALKIMKFHRSMAEWPFCTAMWSWGLSGFRPGEAADQECRAAARDVVSLAMLALGVRVGNGLKIQPVKALGTV
jgi:hypothetical protein